MTVRAMLPRLLLGLVILACTLWLALNRDQLGPAAIEAAIHNLGLWGPVALVLLFALGTVLFVPGTLFGLAGGALFGPLWGTILNLAGATLGATAAFLVARYMASELVRRKTGTRLARLIKGVEAEGWRFVAFTRLVPLIPFNLLNYSLGLTRIPVVAYILASLICMMPGALAYAWLGYAGREALAGNDVAIRYGLMSLALLAAVGFLPRLWRRFKSEETVRWIEVGELASRLYGSDAIAVFDVRGPDEFVGPLGHIPNARNVPLAELPHRIHELGSFSEAPVVLVCRTDKRSASAAALLEEAGFRDITVLRGGMVRWNEAGLPVAHQDSS
ncbi:MAG: VTT domain-containing protein [Hyphomicrobiaceae bacterium]|nr:VTT domain-containing protein [Hyphomicrobiaceae bacterium]